MLSRPLLVRPLQAMVIALWAPMAAFAAGLAVTGSNESPLNVPVVLLIACMVVSTLAGATTLAMQLMRELRANAAAGEPDKALLRPWLNALAHMLGSWLTSTFFFFVCMANNVGVWTLLGTVLLAAFAGSKVLEAVADKFLLSKLPGP